MKCTTWCDWLHCCTWGMTASRSSVAACSLRSWSRRNWMSEAGVSRSWTHNSTAQLLYQPFGLITSHIDLSVKLHLSLKQNHKDLSMRWWRLYLFSSISTAKQKFTEQGWKTWLRSDFHLSRKPLYLLFCNVSGNDYILMLHILSLITHFFINVHFGNAKYGNMYFFT